MTVQRFLTVMLTCGGFSAAQNPQPSLTTIYSFTGGGDGGNPTTRLVIGEGGVLYGTTFNGGASNAGTVFSLTPPPAPGSPWIETVLYSFKGGSDGRSPNTRLVMGSGGVLYGTTQGSKATQDVGTVFSLIPPATGVGDWTETVLQSFGYAFPNSLTISPAGTLYGTTLLGGPHLYDGEVFALIPHASPDGSWTKAVIYTFDGQNSNCNPEDVEIGSGLVLYGAFYGFQCGYGGGVFAVAPPATAGGQWTETVLYRFTAFDGDGPNATGSVVVGGGGVLYGTTLIGGTVNSGMVFSLTPPVSSSGTWAETVVHSFPHAYPPSIPGPLTLGEDGTLYGTTAEGGGPRDGTAYVLKPPAVPGGAWTEVALHTFTGTDGAHPTGVAIGTGGVLYGTTNSGGAYGYGTVFALRE